MSTLETARVILEDAGIRPSTIRVHLLSYLLSHPVHPTVDQIYQALTPEIFTLSKTTVYNTLGVLTEAKLVKQLTIDGKETHYDADTKEHGHFFCTSCGRIYDFTINTEQSVPLDLSGFRIDEKNVYFSGICSKCQNQNQGGKQ